jgi:Gluconate 2-dehydrogenase subunit 3
MAESIRGAGHLPKQRPDGKPADPYELPRQRRGTTPQMHGRYPDYDVMAQKDHWDGVTRELLESREREVPPVTVFTPAEEACLRPFLDVVLAQDAEPRIPVFEMVDKKFADGKLDGYRYEDMPEDPETWRRVAAMLDRVARERGATSFAALADDAKDAVVDAFSQGELEADDLNVTRAWSVVMRGALSEFYSHPWAFNEIGFGGPAYPRGYMRLHQGAQGREPWERPEAFEEDPVVDVPRRGLK